MTSEINLKLAIADNFAGCFVGDNAQDRLGYPILHRIATRFAEARRKHTSEEWQGKGIIWALAALESECKEVRFAVERETSDRVKSELLDLIVVALRMLAREYD